MNSAHLEAFYCCVQVRNFTSAAQRLRITQSALSQRIKNLESELGTTLIVRERSGLRLTEAGESLLKFCQLKEHAERETIDEIRGKSDTGLNGVIRIGGYSSVMRSVILPSLAPLLVAHPELKLTSLTRELYQLRPMLRSGEIDFMILDQDLGNEGLISHTLGNERNVVIQKRHYRGPEVYLDHDEEDTTTARFFRKKNGSEVQRRFLDDIYGILDGVRLGLGMAVVPLHLVESSKDIEVKPKKWMENPVVLHYSAQPYYSKIHLAVISTLVKNAPRFLKYPKAPA